MKRQIVFEGKYESVYTFTDKIEADLPHSSSILTIRCLKPCSNLEMR